MTILQIHQSVRGCAARQINKGRMSIKLLAAKTGLAPSTVTNYVRGRRGLSVAGLSLMLNALGFDADLYAKPHGNVVVSQKL
jgi:transcriptional regulator with XRE-family HTH domain